ncbi:MAG: OmpH family outer membrane protein [Alphaproteobacteria bacterium]
MLKKFFVLCVLAVCVPTVASAAANIAVVDIQKLLTTSDAARDIQKQVDVYKESFLGDISKQEQALRTEEKELSAQQGKMEKEEFAKKVKSFEKKLLDTRRDAQNKKKKLDDGVTKSVAQLREKIFNVVRSIADEKKYDLIISNQNVVIGASALDITDETMKRLNKAVSKIKVDVPK